MANAHVAGGGVDDIHVVLDDLREAARTFHTEASGVDAIPPGGFAPAGGWVAADCGDAVTTRTLRAALDLCQTATYALGGQIDGHGTKLQHAYDAYHDGVDFVATSDDWNGEKPKPEFFDAMLSECGVPAAQIAYVGDRLDNDIRPALDCGLVTVFLRRGPWGYQHHHSPAATISHMRVENLDELPEALASYNAGQAQARRVIQ